MNQFRTRLIQSSVLSLFVLLQGCPGFLLFGGGNSDLLAAFTGPRTLDGSAVGMVATSLRQASLAAAFLRPRTPAVSGGAGTLLMTRDPNSNRILVAEEGVGRWSTFRPAGVDLRVAINGLALRADGQTLLVTTPAGIVVSSLAAGTGHLAAGTGGVFFLDLTCADAATRTCFATAIGRDTATSLYRSTDGGESWSAGGPGLPAGDGGSLFALIAPASGTVLVGSYGNGLFRSLDSGASFARAGAGLPTGIGIQQFAAGGGAVFAATTDGLYRSADAGASWSVQRTGLPATGSPQGVAFKDGALFVAIYDYSSARAGGLFRSVDGGSTFTNVGGTIPAVRFLSVLTTAQAVYAGTSSGVYRSGDGGATWSSYNDGLVFPDTRAVATSGSTVYQGLYEALNGVYRSTDAGSTWLPGDAPMAGQAVTALAASGDVVIAGTDIESNPRGLLRSTDRGATWVSSNAGLTLGPYSGFLGLASDRGTFFAAGFNSGKDALCRSTDSGGTWTSIGGSIPDASNAGLTSVYSVGNLLLAGGRRGVFRSTDGGGTWSALIALAPDGSFDTVSAFASVGESLYAALDTGGASGPEDLLFVSRDQGATWKPVAGRLPVASVNALAATSTELFAGTSKGVHRSTDGGGTWEVFGVGIGQVRSLALGPDTLFAGMRGDGLREIPLTTRATRLVPIVLDVDTGSAHYTTELALSNTGTASARVTLRYTASIGTKEGSGTVSMDLAPGQLVIPDAIAYLRGKGLSIPQGSQGGTLLVTFTGFSANGSVAVLARTATATVAPQPAGRAGLAYSGLRPDEGSTDSLTLYGLRSSASDRSNVAVFSTSDQPVAVKVTAYSGDADKGVMVMADGLELPAYGWTQLSGILQTAGFANGYVTVERVSSAGSFSAYGVINDQGTNDGSYVLPVTGTESLRFLTVPVLVEAGSFLSELVFANRSDVTATFDLTYTESLNGAGGGGSTSVTLAAREQRIVPDAVGFLRANGVSLPPRGSGGFAGTLRVRVSGPSAGKTFIGARTASQSSGSGQFGLFTPAVPGGAAATWQSVSVYGLRADAENRSNVAVFNTGVGVEESVTLELQAFDGDGGGVAKGDPLSVTLGPGQWSQPAGFFAASGVKNGWVKVTRTSGLAAWGAYGVVNDGSAPGERTGDGAYVPSSF